MVIKTPINQTKSLNMKSSLFKQCGNILFHTFKKHCKTPGDYGVKNEFFVEKIKQQNLIGNNDKQLLIQYKN